MIRTFTPASIDDSPATPPSDSYTCPLACSESMTANELRRHILLTAESAVVAMRRQYERNGIADRAYYAAESIHERYAALYRDAVPGPLSDWRDSDGLRGYAARVIRTITSEETEIGQ